jgi:hypothetical protein
MENGIGWLDRLRFSSVSLHISLIMIFILILLVVDALGLQTGNTVLSSYIVDNYPDYANEVITFYSVIINVIMLYYY